ncbi:MAG: HI1506-related protein [Afipia sp.]
MTKSSITKATALDTARDLFNRALQATAVVKVGNEYNFGEIAIGSSKDKAAAFLAEHADVAQSIQAALVLRAQGNAAGEQTREESRLEDAQIEERNRENLGQRHAAKESKAPGEPLTLSFPLPAELPEQALKSASIIVTSKSPSGRRRAGLAFTREETVIPYVEVSAEQIAALTGDPELIVCLRVVQPS